VAQSGLALVSDDALDPSAIERLVRIGGAKLARQMIELFLQHGPDRVALAESGLSLGELRQVEHAAHSIKSSAGNVGATRLQEIATRIEVLLQHPHDDAVLQQVPALVEALRAEYDIAEAELTSKLAELT
jgi:HPt (histidine-containing phosphotransfer) domain-containing protein